MAEFPKQPERSEAAKVLASLQARRFLFVTHDWGGGAAHHIDDLTMMLSGEGVSVVQCRPGTSELTLRFTVRAPDGRYQDVETVEANPGALCRALWALRIEHIHLHSFAGFGGQAPDLFRLAAGAAGLRYDFTVHDYAAFCPRIHLHDEEGRYCGEPPVEECERCIRTRGRLIGSGDVASHVAHYGRLLRGARRVFVPDGDVADRLARHFPGLAVTVRPHPEPHWLSP